MSLFSAAQSPPNIPAMRKSSDGPAVGSGGIPALSTHGTSGQKIVYLRVGLIIIENGEAFGEEVLDVDQTDQAARVVHDRQLIDGMFAH